MTDYISPPVLLIGAIAIVISSYIYIQATKLKKRSVDFIEKHPFWKLAVLITEARMANGYSQEELARKANVSVEVIEFLERTGHFPDAPILLRITDALGKQIDIQLVDKQPPNT